MQTAPVITQERSNDFSTLPVPEGYRFKKLEKTACVFHTLAFVCLLLLLGILSLTLEKPAESAAEKRTLAAMPEFSVPALLEGDYVRDLELHYADTFPFRDGFVSFAAWAEGLRGIRVDDVKIYGPKAPQAPEEAPSRGPAPPPSRPESPTAALQPSEREESSPPPQSEPEEIIREADDAAFTGEQNGSVFVYKGRGMQMFGGSRGMAEWYAGAISGYAKSFGEGVQVYNVVAPTAIEFLLPERYQDVTSPQKPNLDIIEEALGDSVRWADAYAAIGAHADEYVYFNADHHWTGLGAYYAYTAFCESAGIEPLSLGDYETRRLTDFYGTMYTYTNDAQLAADYVDYYIMPVEATAVRYDKGDPYTPKEHSVWAEYAVSPNSYSVFLHGDYPLVHISTEANTGRKALIVKESYGNAFAPFLIPHYDEVYVVDQRYFELNLNEFVKAQGVDDVIFINNIFAANTAYHIECIEGLGW
ncbi:MAG: hypothetical protein LBU86_02835 [Oscillospiraceae bacterium]|nr:hypothetical protein [Oscillospiraceae bacterium]